jgi:hypothetical protein
MKPQSSQRDTLCSQKEFPLKEGIKRLIIQSTQRRRE